ncbi:STAS domain-containing protein [Sutcliffiella horikoshii]|uniref:STAS domain-containing protein n=1 Tax=Sutcliffiella horikoshii TaxID=79883 RepID=A0A5D4S4Q3_9BACI|nr:STAS domain-containing protein [Sutcliffiella horikoshii]TYS58607.1 STAS domain-containing protein [Sutcliffiella horikoshii]TYS71828.1 STAS domain-containing protein [Sutcliffiella horikoshii]
MNVKFVSNGEVTSYLKDHKDEFEATLLSEAVNVASKINDILQKGNIDLLKNAQTLIQRVVEQKESEVIAFAEQEGIAWAKHSDSLTLSFKLEWVQAIRRTLWKFINKFIEERGQYLSQDDFFELEKKINNNIDFFLNSFFLSYSQFKDDLISSQRKLVEHLSVPIIPVSASVAVLPLIGHVDEYRIRIIEEKALLEISNLKLQTLVLDLSGVTTMEQSVIAKFEDILTGVSMMGCKAVLTGLRAELVRKMVSMGVTFHQHAETHGTLQQTLRKYLVAQEI